VTTDRCKSAKQYAGMGSLRNIPDLEDSSRTKNCGLSIDALASSHLAQSNEFLMYVIQIFHISYFTFLKFAGESHCKICHAANIEVSMECSIAHIALPTKLRLYNTCILLIVLYASECWAPTKADVARLDAFDQWCLRRLLRIHQHRGL